MLRLVTIIDPQSGKLAPIFYKKGKRSGRGAWVCREQACLRELPQSQGKLQRAFKAQLDMKFLKSS
jgi:predicted RNA-binding protein YlxR (DUF448 family)